MQNRYDLIRAFLHHGVAANLLMTLMVLAGIWAINQLNTQMNPTRTYTRVVVEILWPGAGPEDMARLVTSPVEFRLRNMNELDELVSTTKTGVTVISAEFVPGADMKAALDEVTQRVTAMSNLPDDIEEPYIYRYEKKELIAAIVVSNDGPLASLIPIVRGYERELLALGIEEVRFNGLPEVETAIELKSDQLRDIQMSLPELAAVVDAHSLDFPAGRVGFGQNARQISSQAKARDAEAFGELIIRASQDSLVRLQDVSQISTRPKEGQPLLSVEGRPAIEMILLRSPATDTVESARIMNDWVEAKQASLPASMTMSVSKEGWQFLKDVIYLLMTSGIQGFALVLVSLCLFLNLRVALWVAAGIPVTLLAAFGLFAVIFDGAISMVSLIAFVMTLGIIVDDAVVVGEEIAFHQQTINDGRQAAALGASSMLSPVFSSGLTTLAAFIPLLLIPGQFGDTTVVFPQIVCCVVIASLIECFLVLPKHLESTQKQEGPFHRLMDRVNTRFDHALVTFREKQFLPWLEVCLRHREKTLSCTLVAFLLATVGLLGSERVGFALGANVDIEFVEANFRFRDDVLQIHRDRYITDMIAALKSVDDQLESPMIVQVLVRKNMASFNDERQEGTQYSSVEVEIVTNENRSVTLDEFVRRWRGVTPQSELIDEFNIRSYDANRYKGSFAILLKSENLEFLKQGSEELKSQIRGMPGVIDVFDDLPYGREQWLYRLNDKARQLGLTTRSVGEQIRAAYDGQRVQFYRRGFDDVEVKVMLAEKERTSLSSLENLPIKTPSGVMLPLSMLAAIEMEPGIGVIRHHDTRRRAKVMVYIDPAETNSMALLSQIQENILPPILARYELESALGEHAKKSKGQMDDLSLGGIYAVILIFIVLAWFFESFVWPLAVMTAIPLALTGAVFGHWVMNIEFGSMSFLGAFALTGIIINDSIILARTYISSIGSGEAAGSINYLMDAVRRRFRPVLLTSLTTIAGVSPLLFGESSASDLFIPLATTICFGMAVGTLLVLIVVPCLLSLVDDFRTRASEGVALVGASEPEHS